MFSAISKQTIGVTRSTSRQFSTLVVADHDNKTLSDSIRPVLNAAKKFGEPVTVLVAGQDVSGIATQAAKLDGVSKVLVADNAAYSNAVAEHISALVSEVQKNNSFKQIISSAAPVNKNWIPRFSVNIDVQTIGDIIDIKSADTFVRPTYAGNALATVKSSDAVKVLTVRPTAFDKNVADAASPAPIDAVSTPIASVAGEWVSEDVEVSDRPDLGSAKIVVSGGRGLKSKENFEMMYELADTMGAAVGASRAAVDAGFCPNDLQVGQTGKVVAPDLYFAIGISGAIQHLAGMKDSKTIVAINKEAEEPIFQVADIGLVGDLFTIVPELKEKIAAARK